MFNAMFYIIPIVVIIVFIFTFVLTFILLFSPKARGKLMSNQIKATKYMVDETKDDIRDISTDMANATKEGIETTVHAIKRGITKKDEIFCRHCGNKIDEDSKYCKHCGKEQ